MKKLVKVHVLIIALSIHWLGLSPSVLSNTLGHTHQIMESLAHSPAWLGLGFYQKSILGNYQSEMDDVTFFLSGEKGFTSPAKELAATLSAFNHTNEERAKAVRCTYPARLIWIESVLPDALKVLPLSCEALNSWKDEFNAESVSLIFPSAYIDNPPSMFGHTLLRINTKNSNPILSKSINYAATRDPNDSEAAFIYKGIVGGYPGDVTVLPYYMKLKEYKDMESRDIWEYQLNLTKTETDLLLDVIWEVKNKRFDYYFFTENCSYRILSFIHAVRPIDNLLEDFPFATIPVDTVRALRSKGFISTVSYRPSVKTQFNHSINQLNEDEQLKIIQWAGVNSDFKHEYLPQDPARAAALLDVAFEYSRISKSKNSNQQKISYDLLSARKNITEKSSIEPITQPLQSDDEGHKSNYVGVSVGHNYEQQYIALNLRPAYHDLLDPPLGYPSGSRLKFGALQVNYYSDDGFKLERFDAVAIASINERNAFFKPLSWKLKLGAERYDYRDDRVLAATLEGLVGHTYQIKPSLNAFMLFGGDMRLAPGYQKGFNVYALAQAGLLFSTSNAQYRLNINSDVSTLDIDDKNYIANFEYVYNVNTNQTVSFNVQRQYLTGRYNTDINMRMSVFF